MRLIHGGARPPVTTIEFGVLQAADRAARAAGGTATRREVFAAHGHVSALELDAHLERLQALELVSVRRGYALTAAGRDELARHAPTARPALRRAA